MTPFKHQLEIAKKGYETLKELGWLYLAMEERTGKTLTALLIAEQSKASKVLILTKKAALQGWEETLRRWGGATKPYTLMNYHSCDKAVGVYDLIILDEAHSSGLATYPKPGGIYKKVRKLTHDAPVIFLSASPYAESLSQLYPQLNLTKYSPFRAFATFYTWFASFGIPTQKRIGARLIMQYNQVKKEEVLRAVESGFIRYTRKDLGFEHEPEDVKHYIELASETKARYNELMKKEMLFVGGEVYAADAPIKLRAGLYQIEGGTLKLGGKSLVLGNTEKIDYIKANFSVDVAIMANFVAEQELLRKHFTNVYSATAHAEAIDLSHIKDLVIYSMNFSTAQFIQRRARQANKHREDPIRVHFLLVENAVSEQVYETVAVKKQNFTRDCFERVALC